MKLEVFGNKKEKEKVGYLKLEKYDNEIRLRVCDSSGGPLPCGVLLTITEDKTVLRARAVNESFGFNLDDKGRIIIEDDY